MISVAHPSRCIAFALAFAALLLAGGADAQNKPVSGLTPRGAIASTDQFVNLPAGATTALSSTAADIQNYVLTSVKAFGAKGDGVTDDTSAWQAAINSGQRLYCPVGIYLTSATLTVTASANQGQLIAGSGQIANNGTGQGRCTIKPTSAVSVGVEIDGSPFSSYVTGVAFENLALDMTNMGSGAIGFLQGQSFDIRFTGVRVVGAAPSTGKISWQFNPGAYVTKLDTVEGGAVKWNGNGSNNPTTTMITNGDIQSVQANQAGNITLVGGAVQPPYYSGQPLIYLAPNSPLTPRGLSNSAGLYLIAADVVTNVVNFTVVGTDFENGGGYPSTANDGTHGTLSAYPVNEFGSGSKNVALVNPAYSGLYQYDSVGATTYFGGNAGGGAQATFFNTPTWFSNSLSLDNGSTFTGYADARDASQTFQLNAATGAELFALSTIRPLSDASNVFHVQTAAGVDVFSVNTNSPSASLSYGAYLAGYSDNQTTLNWGIDSTGKLTLYVAGAPKIVLTPANGTISATGSYLSGGSAGVTCSGAPTSSFATVGGIVTHC